ncbi:MAG: tRNA pseudouridine(55) synthase TruB [Candidatus Krumholzibacteria bacterium]|nr:tRNA pseudouridine(55) synthase TruB [Candidatus Krumholzibacteria bacterium]
MEELGSDWSRFNNRVIAVNKSAGLSTFDVIRKFRKIIRVKKIGHSGTLDPLATGLVLLLTGAATKLSGYLIELPKKYIADIKLGEATDTQDAEGAVIRAGDWENTKEENITAALAGLTGLRKQTPPMFSALKHRGIPLYALAREGKEVDREPRDVNTYSLRLVECDLPVFRIEIHCSRGMYVRVLAEEIGDALGVPAHLHRLVRTEIGHFNLDDAIDDGSFEQLLEMEKPGTGLSEALRHLPLVELDDAQKKGLMNGVAPRIASGLPAAGSLVRLILPGGRLGAIAEAEPAGLVQLKKVFAAVESDGGA